MAEFTKSDLRSGMIVTLRNGKEGIVFLDCSKKINRDSIVFVKSETWCGLCYYKENLENDSCKYYDIIKVEETLIHHLGNLDAPRKLLWEREEVKELTIAEIEAFLGCKVKIVGDNP